MSNVNELLDIAKSEINHLDLDEAFLVLDIFKGYRWNRISQSERLLFGTLFLNYNKSEAIGAVWLKKVYLGQQKYQMIKNNLVLEMRCNSYDIPTR
ncbi:MAG TPA: hypothetical protein DDW58_03385 [Clostridiaceae bacterium]|jgi:hypothetical protein|nr:hypothetical protein [Clostridiaceae bacterium]HBG38279.1 hypothetical protein [Clostridiaceae bacterium]HBN28798.1 hypothetical protein [Clostridiaceae bacterium]